MLRVLIVASSLGAIAGVAALAGFSWPSIQAREGREAREGYREGASGEAPGFSGTEVAVRVDGRRSIAVVDQRFLSFAVDTAQVVGGEFWAPPGSEEGLLSTHAVSHYDFARPRLRHLTAALAPAYLRIGGTDADRTVYRMDDESPGAPPEGARWVLTRQRWDQVNAFARELDLRLMFTLNAGPSARDSDGVWDPENARRLISYSQQQQYPVDVWELGNEINAFPLTHQRWLSADRYAADLRRARALLRQEAGTARLAGVSSAFWPVIGEGRSITDGALRGAGDVLDIVTWHYYPQQSHRCPLATRRADLGRTLSADRLGDVERWAAQVEASAHAHAPAAAVWLGETASAQCGGEPGLSNSFADALWWLDELGRMARRGQQVVVRQTLSGSDYGLIDDETMQPNPSYWASWLWRRLAGTRVLDVAIDRGPASVRAYAHCLSTELLSSNLSKSMSGGIVVVFLNTDPNAPSRVTIRSGASSCARVFRLQADGLASRTVRLNGRMLETADDGTPPALASLVGPPEAADQLTLAPLSAAFVVLPDAHAVACP